MFAPRLYTGRGQHAKKIFFVKPNLQTDFRKIRPRKDNGRRFFNHEWTRIGTAKHAKYSNWKTGTNRVQLTTVAPVKLFSLSRIQRISRFEFFNTPAGAPPPLPSIRNPRNHEPASLLHSWFPYSINQNQDSGILRRLHHVLKLPVSCDRCFELG